MMINLVLYGPLVLIFSMLLTLVLPRFLAVLRPLVLLAVLMMMLFVLVDVGAQGFVWDMVYFDANWFVFGDVVLAHISWLNYWVVCLFLVVFVLLVLYAFSVRSRWYWFGLVLYGAGAFGVVLTKHWLVFVVFWEMVALGSLCLLTYQGTPACLRVAKRYLMVHLFSGLCLLVGVLMLFAEKGSFYITLLDTNAAYSYWIALAFLIKVGAVGVHGWVVESYPSASPMSWPALCVFSTKLGLFALFQCFFGWSFLVVVGVVMLFYPVFFVFFTKDVNRVLCYALLSQLGLMLMLIGLGVFGVEAFVLHLVVHVLYKLLFFMVTGCLCVRSGGDVGVVSWPRDGVLLVFLLFASAAALGLPLLGSFMTKSLVFEAVSAYGGVFFYWLVLAGVLFSFVYGVFWVWHLLFCGKKRGVSSSVVGFGVLLGMYASMGLLSVLLLGIFVFFDVFGFWLLGGAYVGFSTGMWPALYKLFGMLVGALILYVLMRRLGWLGASGILDLDQLWARYGVFFVARVSSFLFGLVKRFRAVLVLGWQGVLRLNWRFSRLGWWSSAMLNVWAVFLLLLLVLAGLF